MPFKLQISLILKKLSLFVASFLLSFTLCELFLKFFVSTYTNERTFLKADFIETGEQVLSGQKPHNQNFEIFKSPIESYQIITVGDSFTNAGNVKWHESYPFNLFLELNQKVTVQNIGVCEETSNNAYTRIKNNLEKNSQHKNKIFVLLVGAADMFLGSEPAPASFFNAYDENSLQEQEHYKKINFKLTEEKKFFSHLYTLRLIRYLSYAVEKAYLYQKEHLISDIQFFLDSNCFRKVEPERKLCLSEEFNKVATKISPENQKMAFQTLYSQIMHHNYLEKSSETTIISDLMLFGDRFPKVLMFNRFSYNLAAYTLMQSHYTLKKDTLSFLQKNYAREKDFLESPEHKQQENFQRLLQVITEWSSKTEDIKKKHYTSLRQIISEIQSQQAKMILMTYPLGYTDINANIRALAVEMQVPLLDLEKEFAQLYTQGLSKAELIGDWEHCTPAGYKIIANLLAAQVKALTSD